MRVRRLVSLLLVLSGVVLLGMAGLHYWRGFEAQNQGKRQWEERRIAAPPTPPPPSLSPRENPGIEGEAQIAATPAPSYPYGQPVARLRIPSARIDTVVFGGANQASLEKGPGHLPGSELPGEDTGRGNCVITGHRDSHFRNLGWLRKGNRIEVETPSGQTVSYEVVSREIVKPDAVRVLAPTAKPRLTLITCYPFNYVGSAPERLVVVAEPALRHRS